MWRQQSRRGLGDTDGLAFVSHAGVVFSGRHPLGVETENSHQGIPSPTSESYLPNSAILLDASRTWRAALGFWGNRDGSRRVPRNCRSCCGSHNGNGQPSAAFSDLADWQTFFDEETRSRQWPRMPAWPQITLEVWASSDWRLDSLSR